MSLIGHFKRQLPWRDWKTVLDATPLQPGQLVLDLGCGVGDVAALLVERGARVVGIDLSEEALSAARARGLSDAEFHALDLRTLPDPALLGGPADGLWSGFSIAYFPDAVPVLRSWLRQLRHGGWITFVDIDDLFAHEPVDPRTRALLSAYAEEGLAAGRYDFCMGRRLRGLLKECGCRLLAEGTLADREFSRDGPVDAEVLTGWSERFDNMKLLRERCGDEFEHVRAAFLDALRSDTHRSLSSVRYAVGIQ